MPLTEVTHKRVVDETEAVVTDATVTRKLYTLRELRDGKHIEDEPEDIIESRISGAYQTALEWLAQGSSEMWDGRDDEEWLNGILKSAGVIVNWDSCHWNVGYGGTYFTLPRTTEIDVPDFLRAMKDYFAGVDFRRDGIHPDSWIVAPERRRHKTDLRSKDARLAKEYGLTVQVVSNRSTDEIDFDGESWRHQEEFTEAFREDCNEFLSELCHVMARGLEDDYESVTSEEYLLETADANEYTFDKYGKLA